jgi:Zn-dependent oligopeptidase
MFPALIIIFLLLVIPSPLLAAPAEDPVPDNPLLIEKWTTPFGVPPFDQLRDEHFLPAFEAFKEKGLFDQETARSFRKNILERGGTADPMELWKAFRGREPRVEPLLARRGFK